MATTTTTDSTTEAPHPDHAGGSVTTTDHAAIQAWAEARGGKPAAVEVTGNGDDVGVLRIEFPGSPNADDAKLTEITWEAFFEKFDAGGLALVYQEETAGGATSSFNRLVKRQTPAVAPATSKPVAKKAATKKSTAKKATAKKAAAKKVPPKPPAAKKSAAKKSAAKKIPVAKKSAKKSATKKTAAKKTAAKKSAAKKASVKKVPPSRGFRGR
jgi:hypothetical protein